MDWFECAIQLEENNWFRAASKFASIYFSATTKHRFQRMTTMCFQKISTCFFFEIIRVKKFFQEMGGRAFGPPQAQALAPSFLERDFSKNIFFKHMNSVLHAVWSCVSKYAVLTCVEIYSCKISGAVLNRWIPDHSISDWNQTTWTSFAKDIINWTYRIENMKWKC